MNHATLITAQCRAKTLSGFDKTGLDYDSTAFSCYGLGMFQQGETPPVSWFHGKSHEDPMDSMEDPMKIIHMHIWMIPGYLHGLETSI